MTPFAFLVCRTGLLVVTAVGVVRAQAFTPREVWRVNGRDAELGTIGWMTAHPSGAIVVSDPRERRVMIFNREGERVASVGRRGAGPGEFQTLSGVGWLGDTLWIGDAANRRFTFLRPNGALITTTPWPLRLSPSGRADLPAPPIVASVPMIRTDGSLVLMSGRLTGALAGIARRAAEPATALVRADPDARLIRVVGGVPGVSCWGAASFEEFSPLCPTYKIAFARDGSRFVVAGPAHGWPTSPTVRITSISSVGDTLFRADVPVPLVRVPRSVLDSNRGRPLPPGSPRASTLPEFYPPVEAVLVGRDGTTWVEVRSTAAFGRWLVLDPMGAVIGHADFPDNVVLKEVGRGYALGFERDADDVPSPVMYEVRAPH